MLVSLRESLTKVSFSDSIISSKAVSLESLVMVSLIDRTESIWAETDSEKVINEISAIKSGKACFDCNVLILFLLYSASCERSKAKQ